MKLFDYDFRDYERKFVIVSKCSSLLKKIKKEGYVDEDDEEIDLSDLKEPFYGYLFIDNERGILLRVLGNDKTQRKYAKDCELLIEYNDFKDCEFNYIIMEELDYGYDISNDYDEEYYDNIPLLNVREKEELDHLREEYNPDILQITIPYDDGTFEYLDVLTLESYEEEETIIVVRLLESSDILKQFKKGALLGVVYKDEELRIKYTLEEKTEEEKDEWLKEQELTEVDLFNENDEDYE